MKTGLGSDPRGTSGTRNRIRKCWTGNLLAVLTVAVLLSGTGGCKVNLIQGVD